tara:strand:- start:85 stop:444 length:360 start_codon:yes stop_codon:yes gene_type:complete
LNNKALIDKIKKELVYLVVLFVVSIIVFKIGFFNEGIGSILKTVFSVFWILILPGFFILYKWHEKLHFLTRFIVSIGVGAALMGIGSYYLGIVGVHIKYHTIVLPLIIYVISSIIILRK